jgi:predicted permease
MRRIISLFLHSLRAITRNRIHAIVTISVLAFGIGGNTLIFSIVNTVLLQHLPYRDPGQLVWVSKISPARGMQLVADSEFQAWGKASRTLEAIAAYSFADMTVTGKGEAERIKIGKVTASFFPVFGVQPAIGRAFSSGEDSTGATRVVLLSDSFWQHQFDKNPTIIGQSMVLNGSSYTVIGILGKGVRFPQNVQVDALIPLSLRSGPVAGRPVTFVNFIVGRLLNGATSQQAASELTVIDKRIEATFPPPLLAMTKNAQLKVVPLKDELVKSVRLPLLMLTAAVGFLLLIACANVANLQVARTITIRKEISIRLALGAGWRQLTAEILSESVALAALGGAVGLVLAYGATKLLPLLAIRSIPQLYLEQLDLNKAVIGFTGGCSLLVAVLFGLAPVCLAHKTNLSEAMKVGTTGLGVNTGFRWVHKSLVMLQLTLSLVLLVGSLLLAKSLHRLMATNIGADTQNVLVAEISLPAAKYRAPAEQRVFFEQLVERLEKIHGVASAAAGTTVPLWGFSRFVEVKGPGADHFDVQAGQDVVTTRYFQCLRTPLMNGRFFNEHDTSESSRIAIINQAFARSAFGGGDPLGKQIRLGNDSNSVSIVGVVADARHSGLTKGPSPQVFVPFMQNPEGYMLLAVRTSIDAMAALPAVRAAIGSIDQDVPAYGVKTIQQVLSEDLASDRLNSVLLTSFASLAIVISTMGVFGVVSCWTSQRLREIGIRAAVGASRSQILRIFVGQMFRLGVIAVIVGLAISIALVRTLSSMLHDVSPFDPQVFAIASLLVLGMALLASYLPASRAVKMDPVAVLRNE